MAHTHENCDSRWGTCTNGGLSDYCTYEDCNNPYCSDLGHCPCKCHSGKLCGCGYQWERLEKMTDAEKKAEAERKAAEEAKRKEAADWNNYLAGGAIR